MVSKTVEVYRGPLRLASLKVGGQRVKRGRVEFVVIARAKSCPAFFIKNFLTADYADSTDKKLLGEGFLTSVEILENCATCGSISSPNIFGFIPIRVIRVIRG
jgi:hypothetical protein